MDTIIEQCMVLQRLVHAPILDQAAIGICKSIIEGMMQLVICSRKHSPFTNAKYRHKMDLDLVFEALCYVFFDHTFKELVDKHKHATATFAAALQPYFQAGVLKFTDSALSHSVPLYYILRFRVRRYSYRHRVLRLDKGLRYAEHFFEAPSRPTFVRIAPVALLKPTVKNDDAQAACILLSLRRARL